MDNIRRKLTRHHYNDISRVIQFGKLTKNHKSVYIYCRRVGWSQQVIDIILCHMTSLLSNSRRDKK